MRVVRTEGHVQHPGRMATQCAGQVGVLSEKKMPLVRLSCPEDSWRAIGGRRIHISCLFNWMGRSLQRSEAGVRVLISADVQENGSQEALRRWSTNKAWP